MKNALELRAALLALIDQRRIETGDPALGANMERLILEEDLEELDRDILPQAGTADPQLVLLRRKKM